MNGLDITMQFSERERHSCIPLDERRIITHITDITANEITYNWQAEPKTQTTHKLDKNKLV